VIGQRIGAYSVVQQIGEGGMGSVWMAEHVMIGRRAAIKMLHAHISNQPDLTTRFFNEAKAAAAIQDPGIVQIFDFGQHTDGRAYLVMELLEGESLERRLARLGRLPLGEALRIMQQVAGSLGAVHQRGIVHRDLKPDNIFLVRDLVAECGERAKILDFGIAKISGASGMKTETSLVMGTPMFMSPEQCRGAGLVDQRSDVYSLGCVLFMLITGRPPFVAEGTGEIIAMHLREPAPAPSSLVPGVPHSIDALVLRCMEKDPSRRFASAADLADALMVAMTNAPDAMAPAISQQMAVATPLPNPVSLIRIVAPGQQATTLSTYAHAASGRPRERKPSSPLMGWLYVGLAAAGISIGAVIVTTLSEEPLPPPVVENVTIGASIESRGTAASPAATPAPAPPAPEGSAAVAVEPAPAAGEPAVPPESKSSTIAETAAPPAAAPPAAAPPAAAPPAAAPPAPGAVAPVASAPAAPAKSDRPNLDVVGTRAKPAPRAQAAVTPAGDDVPCDEQAAKADAFISRAATMSPAAAMKVARALGTVCLDSNQRFRLALVTIPIACSINDRASVTRFFNLASSESLRARCKKFLAAP
jgi:serine/threonine protein kinase